MGELMEITMFKRVLSAFSRVGLVALVLLTVASFMLPGGCESVMGQRRTEPDPAVQERFDRLKTEQLQLLDELRQLRENTSDARLKAAADAATTTIVSAPKTTPVADVVEAVRAELKTVLADVKSSTVDAAVTKSIESVEKKIDRVADIASKAARVVTVGEQGTGIDAAAARDVAQLLPYPLNLLPILGVAGWGFYERVLRSRANTTLASKSAQLDDTNTQLRETINQFRVVVNSIENGKRREPEAWKRIENPIADVQLSVPGVVEAVKAIRSGEDPPFARKDGGA
jgi:hypothetical protein